MTEPDRTHTTALSRFPADSRVWADRAVLVLALQGVSAERADAAMSSAADLLADTGGDAEDVFGPADDWARDQMSRWEADGIDPLTTEATAPARTYIPWGFGIAAVLSSFFLVVEAFSPDRGGPLAAGLLAAPTALAFAVLTVLLIWDRMLRRAGFTTALVAASGATFGWSLLIAALFFGTNHLEVGTRTVWTWLAVAGANVLLAGLSHVLFTPGGHTAGTGARRDEVAEPIGDDVWLARAAGALRATAYLPEHTVRERLLEAESFASESGSSLQAEFGDPETYARSVSTSTAPGRRARLNSRMEKVVTALALGLLVLLAVADLADGGSPHPATVVALTGLVVIAGLSLLKARRSPRRSS